MSNSNKAPPVPSAAVPIELPVSLDAYQAHTGLTDRSGKTGDSGLAFVLLGLFGEVGSLLSALKKKQRDKEGYTAYREAIIEEFGDVLWYFANATLRMGLALSDLASRLSHGVDGAADRTVSAPVTFKDLQDSTAGFTGPTIGSDFEHLLLVLAGRVGILVEHFSRGTRRDRENISRALVDILSALIAAADDVEVDLEQAAILNLEKTLGRWPIALDWGALFDADYPSEEQLPRHLVVKFMERTVAERSYVVQQINGINIGDRLTDNRQEPDDYRFHDVFHLAFAAVLGWSPVMRALLKLKRKSRPEVDENEDGARAAIIEEGIATWIFNQGVRNAHFKSTTAIDYSLLKAVHELVRGFEVERRPLWQWELAILEGFRIFRELKIHRGGKVVLDLVNRTINFEV